MKTLGDMPSTALGASVAMSLFLAPFAASLILPFWVFGKMVEFWVGPHVR